MKKLILSCSLIALAFFSKAQSVAVNTDGSTANASSIFDVKSTNKGMLIPRMTSAQRTAIASPALGLLVFDTDTKTIWAFNGITWTNLTTAGSSGNFALPFDQTVSVSTPAFRIENNGTGDVLQIGNLGAGTGLNVYTTNGFGINVNTSNNMGILATSHTSNAIHAFTNNPANTIPTIRANNTGGGVGIHASSTTNNGILATTSAVGFSGVRGEASVNGANGIFGSNTATTGVGVRGEASGTGTGVIGYSTNGTGMSAGSISGTGLYANSISGLALNVNGNVKIAGGNTAPGVGKVLTSDANGNATWQAAQITPKIAFRAAGVADAIGLTNSIIASTFAAPVYSKVEFKAIGYDFGNGYTPYNGTETGTSSTYIIPVRGLYHFDASIQFVPAVLLDYTDIEIVIMLVRDGATTPLLRKGAYVSSLDNTSVAVSGDVTLLAGDKVYVAVRQFNISSLPSLMKDSYDQVFFNGHMVFSF